jgi:hypothetical protein
MQRELRASEVLQKLAIIASGDDIRKSNNTFKKGLSRIFLGILFVVTWDTAHVRQQQPMHLGRGMIQDTPFELG